MKESRLIKVGLGATREASIKVDRIQENRMKEPLWIECQCCTHVMKVEVEDDQVLLSLWTHGFEDKAPSLIDRLATCWKVLTTGRVSFADMVLDAKDGQYLKAFLDAELNSGPAIAHNLSVSIYGDNVPERILDLCDLCKDWSVPQKPEL